VHELHLTFDDGPDAQFTGPLLDLLSGAAATATFFVIAPRAAACPAVIERMLADGHTVGLHCNEHVRHTERDADWLRADTRRALSRLREVGVTPNVWRVPWGATADWTASVAAAHALRLVHWTADTHDWRGDSSAAMFADTRDALTPGAIVLAHDGIGPGALRDDARETLAYVELVIPHARESGLALRAI
jgi:peptidoglycan/xylan/chitin deacetylase (PgdA/CDA1 family)